jgi:hypothetical protein
MFTAGESNPKTRFFPAPYPPCVTPSRDVPFFFSPHPFPCTPYCRVLCRISQNPADSVSDRYDPFPRKRGQLPAEGKSKCRAVSHPLFGTKYPLKTVRCMGAGNGGPPAGGRLGKSPGAPVISPVSPAGKGWPFPAVDFGGPISYHGPAFRWHTVDTTVTAKRENNPP